MKVLTLKKRKDFIRAAKGFKIVTNGLVLQAALSLPVPSESCCFVGYTTTKKLGKACLRNYTKRRLRAAVQLVLPENAISGVDYVFIGRHNTTTLNFAYLVKKMREAVIQINKQIKERESLDDKKDDDCSN